MSEGCSDISHVSTLDGTGSERHLSLEAEATSTVDGAENLEKAEALSQVLSYLASPWTPCMPPRLYWTHFAYHKDRRHPNVDTNVSGFLGRLT